MYYMLLGRWVLGCWVVGFYCTAWIPGGALLQKGFGYEASHAQQVLYPAQLRPRPNAAAEVLRLPQSIHERG